MATITITNSTGTYTAEVNTSGMLPIEDVSTRRALQRIEELIQKNIENLRLIKKLLLEADAA